MEVGIGRDAQGRIVRTRNGRYGLVVDLFGVSPPLASWSRSL